MALALVSASCEKDDKKEEGGVADGTVLQGTLTQDVTLKAGNSYKLSGEYIVEAGNTVNASLSFADFAAIVSANSRASGWTK